MSNLFGKAFFRVLNEADDVPVDQMSDDQAMLSTLDDGTDPTMLDVHQGSRDAAIAAARTHNMMVDKLNTWCAKIDEFIEFINGTGDECIQGSLAKADDKTIFGSLRASSSKKIGLAAAELAQLRETLRTLISSANDAKYKGM